VKILAVATASATAAIAAALVLARSISNSIERVRAASAELARGELGARAPEDGPAEVAELAASFNEMAGNLEELFDARRQLVAWASHDLRTPLASMQAMLEALEDGLAEPEQYLPALQDQVRTLGMLVDDLFELARIDAGALTLELRDATLGGLVENCLRSLAAEATAKHVSLQSRCDGSAGPVRCAPDKVERVLFNLLTNALRHTPSDGSVAVLVAPEGSEEVRVTVEDTGEGIPAEACGESSTGSGAATWREPGRAAAPGLGSPSPAGSWRHRADESGPRRVPAAGRGCALRCRLPS
jgi:signal transduction histidine kinase